VGRTERNRKRSRPARPPTVKPARPPRRWLWWTVAAALLCGAGLWTLAWYGSRLTAFGGSKLNVLLITLDTTRADYLGCYGRRSAQTPNLDRLARQGVLFKHCTASSPQTLPSHCSILTGLYPFAHGVRRNGTDELPAAAVTLAEAFKSAGYRTYAAIAAYVLNRQFGTAQGFDVYRDVDAPRLGGDPLAVERKGNEVCDDAIQLLRSAGRHPFFMWVHFYDPHYPYESRRVGDPASPAAYEDEIAFMDLQIGRLLDELARLKLDHRTAVVVVGDHGEGLNDHGEYQHGFFLYQTTLHVPLIVRCPGRVATGHEVEGVVRIIDVAPTIVELAGLPPLEDVQGVSLVPMLTGQTTDLHLAAYGEAPEAHTLLRLSRQRSLTVGNWKYVLSSRPQLYDLESDPQETHDLTGEHPDRGAELRDQLRALIAQAPPPLQENPAQTRLTDSEIARLESLGYMGVVADELDSGATELDAFEPQGVDPREHVHTIAVYDRAREAIRAGHFEQAEPMLQAVVAALPEAPSPLRDLAFVLGRLRKFDQAAEMYERALAVMPKDSRTRAQYASMLMDARRWEAAMLQARQVLALTPDDFSAHSMLGIACAKLERWDEAQQHLEAAVRVEPRNTNALHTLGQVYYQRGMLPQAAECFRKALAIDPKLDRSRAALQAVEQRMRAP